MDSRAEDRHRLLIGKNKKNGAKSLPTLPPFAGLGRITFSCTQDFAKSIKDGRWAEQKDRLLASSQTVFFLLEGNFRNIQGGLPYGSLAGAYVNAALLDGVHVIRTVDIIATKYIVVQLAKKLSLIHI